MKTDYFNLIESKVNTQKILKKKISKILCNKQTGGVIPLMVAKHAAKKIATSPIAKDIAKNIMNDGKDISKNAIKNGATEVIEGATDAIKETATEVIEGATDAIKETATDAIKEGDKTVPKGDESVPEGSETVPEGAETVPEGAETVPEGAENATEAIDETVPEVEPLQIEKNNNKVVYYPKKLQIIPRYPHMEKKLSQNFATHIEKVQKKIDDSTDKIDKQTAYIEEDQRILDAQREILEDSLVERTKEDSETTWVLTEALSKGLGWLVEGFMTTIYSFLLLIIKFLLSIQPVLWFIFAIIGLIVLILLIAWLIHGGKATINTDTKSEDPTPKNPTNGDKNGDTDNNYYSGGPSPDWDWNGFIKDPIKYSLKRNINNVNRAFNIPDTFNKLMVIADPIYTIKKNFKLLNNDNLKENREQYINNNKDIIQRDDSISFINYDLIEKNQADTLFETYNSSNYSISLLKPKNIEWELPHLDYKINRTDMDKLPESIKNYKDDNNATDYSLNDTSKIIFPWEKNLLGEWVLKCATKFTNGEPTHLYKDNENNTHCVAQDIKATKY